MSSAFIMSNFLLHLFFFTLGPPPVMVSH